MINSNTYNVIRFSNSFMYVIANTNILLSELIKEVNSNIRRKPFQGTVVFDMIIVNGNNKRRFFQSFANNDNIKLKDVELMEAVPTEIIDISSNYLKTNINMLNHGSLTKFEIEEIKDSLTNQSKDLHLV